MQGQGINALLRAYMDGHNANLKDNKFSNPHLIHFESTIMKSIFLMLLFSFACSQVSSTDKVSDRARAGFSSRVNRVFVEWSPLYMSRGSIPLGSRCRQLTDVYDEGGRLMQHSVYPGSCGTDEIRESYIHAQDGSRIIQTQEIRGENSPPSPPPPAARSKSENEQGQSKEMFKCDSSGRRIETALMKPSGKVIDKTIYSYDAKNRLIETTGYSEEGQISDRRVYDYSNDNLFPSTFTYYGGDGKVYERNMYSDYKFNSYGDWVERKQTTEGTFNRKTISLTFREIEYYPKPK